MRDLLGVFGTVVSLNRCVAGILPGRFPTLVVHRRGPGRGAAGVGDERIGSMSAHPSQPPAAPSSDDILAALDPEQRLVAASPSGPMCVLAGAGTGKTRAITHRIAYGVHSGTYQP